MTKIAWGRRRWSEGPTDFTVLYARHFVGLRDLASRRRRSHLLCDGLIRRRQPTLGPTQSYLTRLPLSRLLVPPSVNRAAGSIKDAWPLSFIFDKKAVKKCIIPFSRIYNKESYVTENNLQLRMKKTGEEIMNEREEEEMLEFL